MGLAPGREVVVSRGVGQTEGERQMPTPTRTREAHPYGEYKWKLATLRRYVVFFFGSKGLREVAAHSSQAKPLFVRNRQVCHLVTHLPVSSFLTIVTFFHFSSPNPK